MYMYMIQFCTLKDWGVQDWGVPLYHNGGSTIISCSEGKMEQEDEILLAQIFYSSYLEY